MKGVDPDRTTFPYSSDPKESKALERQFFLPELRLPAGGIGKGICEIGNDLRIMVRPSGIQDPEVLIETGSPLADRHEQQIEIRGEFSEGSG